MAAILAAAPAGAVGFGAFTCITDNIGGDCAIGTTQLSATVVASGPDALLTITMTGPDEGLVEEVFIESSVVSAISFGGNVGVGVVDFGPGHAGGNLPGGTMVGFVEAFSIMATQRIPENGIGRKTDLDDTSPQSGEFLLTLGGGDFDALFTDLRVGLHVISYSSDGSESFVGTPVPEPASLALVAVGVGLAAAASSRRAST